MSASTFARYQRCEAWVWEQMALTRARVVAGPPALASEIEGIIRSVLTRPRDAEALVVEVADMRARMADIEFIAQYLQLLHAHAAPRVLSPNTRDALVRLCEAGVLAPAVGDDLIEALGLWQAVQNRIRLNLGEAVAALGAEDAPKALRLAVDGLGGLDFDSLVIKMQAAAERVHGHFRQLVEEPAAAARDRLAQP